LIAEETVLRDPEKIPATKNPERPKVKLIFIISSCLTFYEKLKQICKFDECLKMRPQSGKGMPNLRPAGQVMFFILAHKSQKLYAYLPLAICYVETPFE